MRVWLPPVNEMLPGSRLSIKCCPSGWWECNACGLTSRARQRSCWGECWNLKQPKSSGHNLLCVRGALLLLVFNTFIALQKARPDARRDAKRTRLYLISHIDCTKTFGSVKGVNEMRRVSKRERILASARQRSSGIRQASPSLRIRFSE